MTELFGDILTNIAKTSDLDLELDPSCVVPHKGLTAEETIAENTKQLEAMSLALFNRIIDQSSIDKMPREMRAISGYTYEGARMFSPRMTSQLIGGFLILRFIS